MTRSTAKPARRRALLLGVALAAVAALAAPSGVADDLGPIEAKYRAMLKRPSLYKRCQGRVLLARTGSPRALSILTEDYMKPEVPMDHVRYLIASIAAENLTTTAENAGLFATWRRQAQAPIDAWLWYRALKAERLLESPTLTGVAKDATRLPILRAAALRALGAMEDAERAPTVAAVLDQLPTTEPDRSLLIESCAAVARTWVGSALKDEAVRAQIERIAKTLDDAKLSIDTKDIVARNLAGTFQTDVLGPGSAPWLRELAAAAARAEGVPPPDTQYGPGPFFGLRAIGRRIVYVIDASDSMLTPLTPDEIKTLKPTTPGSDEPPGKRLPTPKKDPDEPLPWQRIKNRFDAAREVLKRSLRAMKPDQYFCVILFGNDAKALATTQNLRLAEPKAIEVAVAELDKIAPTPAPGDKLRPNGKLYGETNLHGGIRLAFKVSTGKSQFGPGEYVDLSKTGCDAVFVLSDGAPTTDDFRKVDKRDDEHAVKDRETKAPAADTPDLTFEGPYGDSSFESFGFLADDVRRLNLFRQAEIHCVALGEASDDLLQIIADIGGGRFRRVGDRGASDAAQGK